VQKLHILADEQLWALPVLRRGVDGMTNREKYFLKRDEYDTMMVIAEAQPYCPIDVIGGKWTECENELPFGNCKDCIQKWLNEEAKP
jgi:hypothetical protein